MLGSPYRLFYGLSCNVAAQEWLDCYHSYAASDADTDSYCDCAEDQDTDCDWEHDCL